MLVDGDNAQFMHAAGKGAGSPPGGRVNAPPRAIDDRIAIGALVRQFDNIDGLGHRDQARQILRPKEEKTHVLLPSFTNLSEHIIPTSWVSRGGVSTGGRFEDPAGVFCPPYQLLSLPLPGWQK